MKIVSWNCNMAFRKKADAVLSLNPDLLIIQECENKQKLTDELEELNANDIIWIGNNKHKGIAIFSFNGFEIELSDRYNQSIEFFVPLKVKTKNKTKINLFAVWAMPFKGSTLKSYVGRVWEGINYYEEELTQNSIVIGDLNSNAIWDKDRKVGNHSAVVEFLKSKEIESIYHAQCDVEHGKEQHPTFYLYKNEMKPYHMDYCFASNELISDNIEIQIGRFKDWIKLSDHMPLIIEGIEPC